jgi:hypothetical protein
VSPTWAYSGSVELGALKALMNCRAVIMEMLLNGEGRAMPDEAAA